MPDTTVDYSEREFGPKIHGVYAIHRVVQQRSDIALVVLYSSLAAILGGYGLCAYASANCFMDAFALQRHFAAAASGGISFSLSLRVCHFFSGISLHSAFQYKLKFCYRIAKMDEHQLGRLAFRLRR